MTEIALEDLESYYTEQLNIRYAKQKKVLKKFVERLERLIIELKNSVDKMRERKDTIELEEQAEKYVDRFHSKVKENLDVIEATGIGAVVMVGVVARRERDASWEWRRNGDASATPPQRPRVRPLLSRWPPPPPQWPRVRPLLARWHLWAGLAARCWPSAGRTARS